MTGSITIYKQDGTRQCEPETRPRALESDAKTIADLGLQVVGGGQHLRLPIFTPALCGSPTAWANIFEINKMGLTRHQLFELSSLGFRLWTFDSLQQTSERSGAVAGEDPFPLDLSLAANLLAHDMYPERIADLIGYHIRVYKRGDAITKDYRLDRVNFEIDPASLQIVRDWIG